MYIVRIRQYRQALINEKYDFLDKSSYKAGIPTIIYYDLVERMFDSFEEAEEFVKSKNIDAKIYKLKEVFGGTDEL